ncbi:MAG TPA: amidohydrolase family protein [Actinomycetota bacterium]|nr:amidohydrolase family protein [Actinomycetota bacterium]
MANVEETRTGAGGADAGAAVASIDLHCHLLPEPERSLAYLPVELGTGRDEDEVLYRGASVGPIRRLLTDPAVAVRAMDEVGLERRAMSIAPLSYRYDLPAEEAIGWHRGLNDALVEACGAHPDRLVPIAIVPLQDAAAAAEEARRAVGRLGMRGIEIGTHVAGRNLDSPELEPFWIAAEELGAAVFIHPEHTPNPRWPDYYLINLVGNPVETGVAVASLIFGGVLDRHPGLRFWLAHGGGVAPWVAGRLRHGWSVRDEPRVQGAGNPLEIVASNFWFDSLTHDAGILAALIQRFGVERVVVGSDYPFDMADARPLETLERALPDESARGTVHRTAMELLEPRGDGAGAAGS